MYDSRAISNLILDYADSKGVDLTIMQLLKLTYISHGWSLAYWSRPLVADQIEAWQYGPVIPSLYRSFSMQNVGRKPIKTRAVDPSTGLKFIEKITDEEISLIKAVVESYGHMSAFRLSQKTHEQGTPWSEALKKGNGRPVIPNDSISAHFKHLLRSRQRNVA